MARPFGTKNIETPEKMWEYFEDYIAHTKNNPFKVGDWVGKDALPVDRLKEKPLTLEGFEVYLFKKGILNDLKDYFSNKDERYTDYTPICIAIRTVIRQDQIEGGMAGIYNPSITQRLNGLKETTDITTNGENVTSSGTIIQLANGVEVKA